MHRLKAAGIHLVICTVVATLVFTAVATAWYPGAFLDTAGGLELFALVAGVDVSLGPLLTLIVFVPGKKGLAFDLAVIGFLQACALAYGVHVLFEARPAYVVFVKDRFEIVRANELADEDLAAMPRYASLSFTGPRVVGARLPSNPQEQLQMILSGLAGKDVQRFPRYYVPYEEVARDAAAKGQPIARLRQLNPERGDLVDSAGLPDEALRFLPVRAGKRDLTVLVSAADGHVVKFVALKPWEFQ